MNDNPHINAYLARMHTTFGNPQFMRDILAYATIETERECHVILMHEIRAQIFAIAQYNLTWAQAAVCIDNVDDMLMILCESDMLPETDAVMLVNMMRDLTRVGLNCAGRFIETMQDNAPNETWLDAVMRASANVGAR